MDHGFAESQVVSVAVSMDVDEFEQHCARVREEAQTVVEVGYWDGEPNRPHLLYWAVNRPNLRVYVGATDQLFRKRVLAHQNDARSGRGKTRFHESMRQEGIENFVFVPIEFFPSRAAMNAAEKGEVFRLVTMHPRIGYNSVGGGGCVGSPVGVKAAATRRANRFAAAQLPTVVGGRI